MATSLAMNSTIRQKISHGNDISITHIRRVMLVVRAVPLLAERGLSMSRIVMLAAMACIVSPCAAQKTRVDFDHATHFSCYKTYRLVNPPDVGPPPGQFPNELMQQRIAGFIEEAMGARGLKRVTTGGDLLISFHVDVSEEPFYTTIDNWGPDWGWAGGTGISTTQVQTIYRGSLVIDMVDAYKNQLVFEGIATHGLSSKPARNTRRLSNAVNDILGKYPPAL
jgi:Domain of unknown function (DUF4136)